MSATTAETPESLLAQARRCEQIAAASPAGGSVQAWRRMEAVELRARAANCPSPAQAAALLAAQSVRRAARAERIARLQVPAPFAGSDDFMGAVNRLLDQIGRRGHQQQLAAAAGVATSTISRYLATPPKKRPSQPVLDRIVAWWRQHQAAPARPDPVATKAGGRATGGVSLRGLPPEILSRAERTACLRNLTLLQYLAQLIDRHTPSTLELDR